MNKLIIATGSDLRYLKKIEPYLKSVNNNFSGEKILFYIEQDLSLKVNEIHGFNVTNFKYNDFINKNPINCIQHGEFVNNKYISALSDDDIILFTDGDIIMQREINEAEFKLLELNDNEFFVGYNESENDNLLAESRRLNKISSIYDSCLEYKEWAKIPCYNTGVLAGKISSWKKLFELYTKKWNFVDQTFIHYAKQQWLICLILHYHFKVKVMPHSFHTHGHYPLPTGTHIDNDGNLRDVNKNIILLRHKC